MADKKSHFATRCDLEFKSDDEPGVFTGYGSVFGNTDSDRDIVVKGAFRKSLKIRMPALLWQHDQKQPIGRFLDVREDEHGLRVKGQLMMHGRGLEAYELMKMGALNGLSIGFITKSANREQKTGVRSIYEADLREISVVTFAANERATVMGVKSAGDVSTIQDLENLLMQSDGLGADEAKEVVSRFVLKSDLDALKEAQTLSDIKALLTSA